jgi:hypothetical protein
MKVLYLTKKDQGGGSAKSLQVMLSWSTIDHDTHEVSYSWRPHERNSLYTLLMFFASRWWRELKALRTAEQGYDILHINHEGLIWYAFGSELKVVCHIRTDWPKGVWSWLFRVLVVSLSDAVIKISPNSYPLPLVIVIPNAAFERGGGDEKI